MKKYENCMCVMTRRSWKTSRDASRAVLFLDEQRRHSRLLGPFITLRPPTKDIFVEREIKCNTAQPLPVISKVFPVAWRPEIVLYTIAPG